MKKILIITILISNFFACKPSPLDLEIPQAPEKLSISNQYVGEGTLGVALTKSFSALKQPTHSSQEGIRVDTDLLMSGAKIKLSGPGISASLEEFFAGLYGAPSLFLLEGQTYTVTAEHPDFESISANAVKMKKIPFDSISWKIAIDGTESEVFYRIVDEPAKENYYVINYFLPKKSEELPIQPKPEEIAKKLLEQQASFDLITEADFKNGVFQTSRKINKLNFGDSLLVSCSNIEKGYYDFLYAQKRAGTLFNQLRGEVVNFPSNIKNGYGYFSLHEPDFRILTP